MYSKDGQLTATFKTEEGKNVFYRIWKTRNNSKGIVLLVHGLNSHSGYFQQLAMRLTADSFDVYALDLRGRGHSDGERFYIHDYRDIIADINELLRMASAQPSLPIFLFGHSAGAVFASVYTLLYQDKLQGLISESIAFQLPAPALALKIISALAYLIPHKRMVKLNNQDFSRDAMAVLTMENDPLIADEKQPARSMQQLLKASALLKQDISRITLPVLLLHGTGDKATNPQGSQYIMENIRSYDKTLRLYDGHFHDLINDIDNDVVLTDISSWLNDHC
jgi:acylglycerol lipase